MEFNFIGDIAGNYQTLLALLDKMPKEAVPFSVGDCIDRGPSSKDVLYFFKEKGKMIMANHEHMFLDWLETKGIGKFYDYSVWGDLLNGANHTLRSFGIDYKSGYDRNAATEKILSEHKELIDWLKALPMYYEEDDFIVTHAPIHPQYDLERCTRLGNHAIGYLCADSILWNLSKIKRRDKFQIHGHVAHKRSIWLEDREGVFGINLDSSKGKILTGMHWPSKQIFMQEYID